jgi:uncharacterized protein (DUF433 family)
MARTQSQSHERIVRDPDVMVGKPVVRGTRIPVERVIEHLAQNPDVADLFSAYPELSIEDVKACLRYAHDVLQGHRTRVSRATAIGAAHV